jgi:alpha,alpha-trehalase
MRSKPFNPAIELKELFELVQSSQMFPDSKSFADAICLREPDNILSDFQALKGRENFDLKAFIDQNFEIPKIKNEALTIQKSDIISHINSLWGQLSRIDAEQAGISSKISLPYPYVVPGGRFNEIYYWDSYFTMLGLIASGESQRAFHMFNNFVWLVDQLGYIPNGNRSYYLGRSQPPFLSLMADLMIAENLISADRKLLQVLLTEYGFWEKKMTEMKMSNGEAIKAARYCDNTHLPREESYREDKEIHDRVGDPKLFSHLRSACESGWDFSSRWFRDKKSLDTIITADIIPVDLNCLIWNLERMIGSLAEMLGETAHSTKFSDIAEHRKIFINTSFFNQDLSCYDDLGINGDFMHNRTLAGVFPLFFGLTNEEHAKCIAREIQLHFLKDGGLVTTTQHTGQQWDSPNGWAPLQYIAVQGLMRYGCDTLAEEIMLRWCSTVDREFENSGKIMEKYNVVNPKVKGGGGEYPNQDGFGWTNAVYLVFKNQLNRKNS